jgi:hypothetical protein
MGRGDLRHEDDGGLGDAPRSRIVCAEQPRSDQHIMQLLFTAA